MTHLQAFFAPFDSTDGLSLSHATLCVIEHVQCYIQTHYTTSLYYGIIRRCCFFSGWTFDALQRHSFTWKNDLITLNPISLIHSLFGLCAKYTIYQIPNGTFKQKGNKNTNIVHHTYRSSSTYARDSFISCTIYLSISHREKLNSTGDILSSVVVSGEVLLCCWWLHSVFFFSVCDWH